MRALLLTSLLALPALAGELSPEQQLTLTSLRAGERARLAKAVGALEAMPLYRADLSVDPAARTVTGTVVVQVTAGKEPLTEVYLRLAPNAAHGDAVVLSKATVDGAPVKLEHPDDSLYRVALADALPPGQSLALQVTLKARVPQAPAGSTQMATDPSTMSQRGGDYGAFSVAPEVVALPGVLPMLAWTRPDGELAAGPSGLGDLGTFEPSNFLVSVSAPSGWRVVAPGNQLGEVPGKDGTTRYSWAVAGAREFPVFLTRGYEVATKTVGDITVESHFHAGDAKAGKKVLEHAAYAVGELDTRLGPYPYTTFRVLEARLASGAGGMEFPGLVTVGTALYKGSTDPFAMLGMPSVMSNPMFKAMLGGLKPMLENTLEFIVAHEVAHQYFAMLVGSDCVDEPVVDEALTQHTALLLLEWRKGKAAADGMRDGQLRGAYQMYRFFGGGDKAADRSTSEFGNNGEYAAMVYGKAPLLFDAQRELVGDAAWMKALKTYVERYRYRWADATTLTKVAQEQNPKAAKKLELLRLRYFDEKRGDEDVGAFDLESMLGGKSAGKGGQAVNPDLMKGIDPEVLREYEKAMRALGGME